MQSVEQPLQETGSSSTGSQSKESLLANRLSWQINDDAGVNRLARMVAVDDQARCLDWEADSVKRDADAAHAAQWGDGTVEPDAGKNDAGADAMRVMAGGNVTVNHYPTKPEATSKPAPAKGMSPLLKLAAIGLAATGVGIPAAVGLTMAPEIIKAFQGEPAKPSGNLLNDYDLFVGQPE